MKVRIAFAVISQLEEPIILVDEVLAVGDKAFRRSATGASRNCSPAAAPCSSSPTTSATSAVSARGPLPRQGPARARRARSTTCSTATTPSTARRSATTAADTRRRAASSPARIAPPTRSATSDPPVDRRHVRSRPPHHVDDPGAPREEAGPRRMPRSGPPGSNAASTGSCPSSARSWSRTCAPSAGAIRTPRPRSLSASYAATSPP